MKRRMFKIGDVIVNKEGIFSEVKQVLPKGMYKTSIVQGKDLTTSNNLSNVRGQYFKKATLGDLQKHRKRFRW